MSVSLTKLKDIVARLENLEEQKRQLGDDMRDVMAEAKGEGFDPKVLREVLRLRRMRPEEISEKEELIQMYLHALSAPSAGHSAL